MPEPVYAKELMMAIIVASTALIGLTSVVIGQIVSSQNPEDQKVRAKKTLGWAYAGGIFTIGCSIAWFMDPNVHLIRLAVGFFMFQIFGAGFIHAFWVKGYKK